MDSDTIPDPSLVERSSLDRLAECFRSIRDATRDLTAPLSAEDCALQSMPDASPVKWHLAHTTWFFETFVLTPHHRGYRPLEPAYRQLFNSYYDAVGERFPRAERGLLSRPSLAEVRAYRDHVDAAVLTLLSADELPGAVLTLLELGLHHEQQHQELLLTDVKHLLSRNPTNPAYGGRRTLTTTRSQPPTWVPFEAGLREVGHAGRGFSFDNEAPRHRVWLESFLVASHPVTQGEFAAFVADGGYRRPELWLSAGWDAVTRHGWRAPLYWRDRDGAWTTFTLHGEVPLDPHAPACHVSYYEADAYARWAGARLPGEAEWEVAASTSSASGPFLEDGALHPIAPRGSHAPGTLAQAFGGVWEWTRSDYAPYPGFRAAPGAVGEYNGKFMSGQYVLRGGSCVTPAGHVRVTYRNFHAPHARWQFAGLRLARDAT